MIHIMGKIKECCFDCVHWEMEPGVLTPALQRILERQLTTSTPDMKDATDAMIGRATSYGKCTAEYTNASGEVLRHNFNTAGLFKCTALDDKGNQLFSPAPEG